MATNNSCDYSPTQYNVQVGGASGTLSNVAPSSTSGIPLVSGGSSSNPSFTTAVVAGGGTGVTTMTTAYAPVCAGTTATGALQVASTGMSNSGYVLTSTGSSSLPTWQAASGGGFTWTVTTSSASIVAGNGYLANNSTLLTMTLPASGSIGDTFRIAAINTSFGAWKIAQNANQYIYLGATQTTVGTSGYLESSAFGDAVECVCIVSGSSTGWMVMSSVGNILYN